jgi:hypothetical protein
MAVASQFLPGFVDVEKPVRSEDRYGYRGKIGEIAEFGFTSSQSLLSLFARRDVVDDAQDQIVACQSGIGNFDGNSRTILVKKDGFERLSGRGGALRLENSGQLASALRGLDIDGPHSGQFLRGVPDQLAGSMVDVEDFLFLVFNENGIVGIVKK